MRVEIVQDTKGTAPAAQFPPGEKYLDLRASPQAIEGIASARRYLPIRNFLASVNSADSMFATSSAATRSDLPAAVFAGSTYEFASQAMVVFAEPDLNWERKNYEELASALKELLARDTAETVRATMRIFSCDFTTEKRRGFSLGIRLVAEGGSAQQAELWWGLALARVQQALLFQSRALRQKPTE